jgi:HK97 family phage portal protein
MRLPFLRARPPLAATPATSGAMPVGMEPGLPSRGGGGWLRIFESFPGAWQQNVVLDRETILTYFAVYACVTLIASDISKLGVKVVTQDTNGIWTETSNPAYSPVIRKPNNYQNRIQFWESWMLSKLTRGNAYILKIRDNRNVVVQLMVLNPDLTHPLVSEDGSVFYQVAGSRLNGIVDAVVVPAREIIHDRFNTIYHPLIGTSPVWASAYSAAQGMAIQKQSAKFFANASQPGGVLTAPGAISDATALRLKDAWEHNFSGENAGRVAVLGDGLKYERMSLTAVEGQLIEQLKWTADVICSVFHVPPYKIGIGAMPTYNNIQSLNVEYYSQCLQSLIEAAELCLDEGLEMAAGIGTMFDIDNLLRMDTITQMDTLKNGVSGAILAPNEARRKLDLPPVKGGDSPLAQQQNYSLEALAKRDAEGPPPGTTGSASPTPPTGGNADDSAAAEADDPPITPADQKRLVDLFEASFMEASNHAAA